jgi:hypothetical protein
MRCPPPPVVARRAAAFLTAAVLTLTFAGCDPLPSGSPPAGPASSTGASPTYAAAREALAALPVRGRAPRTGYEREAFGQRWADVDRNGCDTRNDVLGDTLTAIELRPGTRDCVVLRGVLDDPYTGELVEFERGGPSEVDIDHVVALSDAWQKGAQQLSAARREAFANDPLNLLAVSASANRQKGDGDAATWLPSNRGFRCEYVALQVLVKERYDLWVTRAERDAIERMLDRCD